MKQERSLKAHRGVPVRKIANMGMMAALAACVLSIPAGKMRLHAIAGGCLAAMAAVHVFNRRKAL